MKLITIKLLEYMVRKAKKTQMKYSIERDLILAVAYADMVKTYQEAIMFLEAEREK